MVFNREKLFYCFKNIWQKLGKLIGHILSIYKSFNTWSCSKYWTKPPKTISAHFKDLKYFYRIYFHKKYKKILTSHIYIIWWHFRVSNQSKLFWFTKVPQNHLCPDSNLNNFTLATFSFWSQLLWTCSEPQMMILH